ncbi:MAG TPA: hypothetical protein VK177_19665 [Flavobacteriales bacterium]|nr:hypothetical protein [Flavobacteriales bacterium]
MKKGLLFGGALLAIALVSCKKDYTCKCTYTSGGVSVDYTVIYKETKKSAAYAVCEGKGIGTVTDEDGNTFEDDTKCTIQ